ncbi:MAG: FkbM family methyltransferase, partial [Flavobacteriales bacterium]
AYWNAGTPIRKPAISLLQMLREHNAPHVIDYLALDTEGSEARILGAFDFAEYEIRAISIEGDACTRILKSCGYTEVRNPFCNVEYEHYYILK